MATIETQFDFWESDRRAARFIELSFVDSHQWLDCCRRLRSRQDVSWLFVKCKKKKTAQYIHLSSHFTSFCEKVFSISVWLTLSELAFIQCCNQKIYSYSNKTDQGLFIWCVYMYVPPSAAWPCQLKCHSKCRPKELSHGHLLHPPFLFILICQGTYHLKGKTNNYLFKHKHECESFTVDFIYLATSVIKNFPWWFYKKYFLWLHF